MAHVVPISVLDLAPVGTGSTPADALRASVKLAQATETLGYRRFWVAEHHNVASVASCSPPVLVAAIAGATRTIQVGSGGVMLPNHQPLVVAEQFGTLEALYPGRINLGIGRAPVIAAATARALGRGDTVSGGDFTGQVMDLLRYLRGDTDDGEPVRAVPAAGGRPPLWLLGTSGRAAQLAGMLGLPFAYAHHIAPRDAVPALRLYRSAFRPSATLAAPRAMLSVGVICADTDQAARWLAGPAGLLYVRMRGSGPDLPLPSPEEAAEYSYGPAERDLIARHMGDRIVGSPVTVRRRLGELVDETGADEVMITTQAHGYADRVRSYELVSDALVADRSAVAG